MAPIFLFGQNEVSQKLVFSSYVDMYYSYDFSNPSNHDKADFIYNFKRHNEFNANLLLVKAGYDDKKVRGNLGLMLGNYAQYNLNTEPPWAQFVYEANLGVKLSAEHNLWLDAGIFPSHIGFESAISADCWTLTRSLVAESSPYYETGLKLSYTNQKEKLSFALLVLNGWQKIRKPDYIQKPSCGIQVSFKPIERLLLNYSNFLGTDQADSLKAFRSFHNLYLQYNATQKIAFIWGFDIGSDKYQPKNYGIWYSPVLIARYAFNDKIKIAFRTEHYNDKHQIIIPTNTTNGFQVTGLSANLDYNITPKAQVRLEGKRYKSKDGIFNHHSKENYSLTTNLSLKI
ncbi:MAG: porin [Spirosomataceae bacterium]